jgi:hypothetical protein
MIGSMENLQPYKETPFRKWWRTRTFLQKRMISFCMSMLSLLICCLLYYEGFFGTVDGPLNPARLGESFGSMGVTKAHSMGFFLSLLIITTSWNWVYNIASNLIGARLTCNKTDEEGKICGAKAQRKKVANEKTGKVVVQYICEKGHKRPQAHFHPVQKGTISNTVWLISLAFCVIVFFLS